MPVQEFLFYTYPLNCFQVHAILEGQKFNKQVRLTVYVFSREALNLNLLLKTLIFHFKKHRKKLFHTTYCIHTLFKSNMEFKKVDFCEVKSDHEKLRCPSLFLLKNKAFLYVYKRKKYF